MSSLAYVTSCLTYIQAFSRISTYLLNVWGSGGIAPPFLTSALDGDEWSASRPREEPPVIFGPPESLWTLLLKKEISCPCRKSNPGRPARRYNHWTILDPGLYRRIYVCKGLHFIYFLDSYFCLSNTGFNKHCFISIISCYWRLACCGIMTRKRVLLYLAHVGRISWKSDRESFILKSLSPRPSDMCSFVMTRSAVLIFAVVYQVTSCYVERFSAYHMVKCLVECGTRVKKLVVLYVWEIQLAKRDKTASHCVGVLCTVCSPL
jgi:hypothetical protein